MKCRHCSAELRSDFLDLGFAPPSNDYLTREDLSRVEKYYPLRVRVCAQCWLVQTEDFTQADALFDGDYAYFSSTSTSWLQHAAHYVEKIIGELALDANSFVVELASNDGYLLRNFVQAGIPCLGVEPTASTAAAAEALGIPVERVFFGAGVGQELAAKRGQADLIIGNNVYAHVPDINDFTRGIAALLAPHGTVTLEFPHLLELMANGQFDTVYHEHFSYLSLHAVQRIFQAAGLRVWRVENLSTHGGSLRVFGCHRADARPADPSVAALLQREREFGLCDLAVYAGFQARAEAIKNDLLEFLLTARKEGKTVVAYGAAAKGNTLLNFAGVRPDLLPCVMDAAPSKQGKFMPGSHIPIVPPGAAPAADYVLILPWNIASEVMAQNAHLRSQGTRFVVAVPRLQVL